MTFPPVGLSTICVAPSRRYPLISAELKAQLADGPSHIGVEDDVTPRKDVLCVEIVDSDAVRDMLPRALDWARRGGLHLPVVVHAERTAIGPLTSNGYSACIQCAGYGDLLDSQVSHGLPHRSELPVLTEKLVALSVAQDIERVTRMPEAVPMTLGGVIHVDHASGTVGTDQVDQVDGCEVCSALIEFVFQGAL